MEAAMWMKTGRRTAHRKISGTPEINRRKPWAGLSKIGAGGENRTRDIQLGKLTFYL
jgi:hypothetical protein